MCLTCTFVNAPKARYCSYCGTNLVLGKGEEVLRELSHLISRKIIVESNTNETHNINDQRKLQIRGYEIPSRFNVEIVGDNLNLTYISSFTETGLFESESVIGIQVPVIGETHVPLSPGMNVRLSNFGAGGYTYFETKITVIDERRGFLFVRYSEDAIAIHSKEKLFCCTEKSNPGYVYYPGMPERRYSLLCTNA